MTDEKKRNPDENDDTYVIEDTGGSIEELEREMRETAEEAVTGDVPPENKVAEGAEAPLRDENRALQDRLIRTVADFDNFRKRAEREKNDFFKFALAAVVRDLLPVLDNFDRALDHAEEGDEFHKGVLLIYKQLFEVLQRHGLRAVEESGVHFDPNIHEAVIREEDASVPSHTVVAVMQKGYFLHDRLLRPAMVRVAVGGPEA